MPGQADPPYVRAEIYYRGINKRNLYENCEKRLLMQHAAFINVYILN